jgi:hypothetical protein
MNPCSQIPAHTDWLTLLAIVVGPILAIAGQLWYQRRKERRDAKLGVFRVLMNLRNAQLSADFVKALNLIDLVFYKDKGVRERWSILWEFLNNKENFNLPRASEIIEKQRDLTAQLLSTMARELGFEFDITVLKNGAYRPQHHDDEQAEIAALRQGLVAALNNTGSLNVKVFAEPPAPVKQALQPATPHVLPRIGYPPSNSNP